MTVFSTNLSLTLPDFNVSTWHDEVNNNFRIIDAAIYTALGFTGVSGIWQNSIAYIVGQKVIDVTDNSVWRCLVGHTSDATDSFATDRANNPTYWIVEGAGFSVRGAWATATVYNIGDVVYDTTEKVIALCIVAHTSTTDIRTDKAAGKWEFIADIATNNAGVFADPADATKVMTFDISGFTTATTRVVTWPDADITFGAYTPTLLNVANEAGFKAAVNLEIGTDVQAYHANLAAFAGLTGAADKIGYFTGSAALALADFSSFARTLLDDTDAVTARSTLSAVGNLHKITVVTSNGTHNFDIETKFALVEVLGAGGGGGGVPSTTTDQAAAGGGGGGGGYAAKFFSTAGISSGTIAIGTGGTAGSSSGGNGGNGDNTSWSDGTNTITGNGGTGGTGGSVGASTSVTPGGAGGEGTGGDYSVAGQPGGFGWSGGTSLIANRATALAGPGGHSFLGAGAIAQGDASGSAINLGGSGGMPLTGGGGGGGAAGGRGAVGAFGGPGRPGQVIIREYK